MGLKHLLSYNYFMKYEEFKKILKYEGITIKKFSELANISYATCNNWANKGTVSGWVEPFLRLYARNNELEAIENVKKDDCEEYKKALAKALQDLNK